MLGLGLLHVGLKTFLQENDLLTSEPCDVTEIAICKHCYSVRAFSTVNDTTGFRAAWKTVEALAGE